MILEWETYKIAAFLEPRVRELCFVNSHEQDEIRNLIMKEFPEMTPQYLQRLLDESLKKIPTQPDPFQQLTMPLLIEKAKEQVNREEEVKRYMAISVPSEKYFQDYTTLDWWKDNNKGYGNLGLLVKKFLAIPASSAAVERIFSVAGNIIGSTRYVMNPKTLDSLTFMRKLFGDTKKQSETKK